VNDTSFTAVKFPKLRTKPRAEIAGSVPSATLVEPFCVHGPWLFVAQKFYVGGHSRSTRCEVSSMRIFTPKTWCTRFSGVCTLRGRNSACWLICSTMPPKYLLVGGIRP